MTSQTINVVGAGIFGLWQAYRLANDGFQVRLYEKSAQPFANASSRLAGAMLAPFCEAEASEQHLIPHALQSLDLWRASPFALVENGTLIVAPPRDGAELTAFAKRTLGHQKVEQNDIEELEPDLADRFANGLYYNQEAHLAPRPVLQDILDHFIDLGGQAYFGHESERPEADYEIDTRGMGAKQSLNQLRPVRGEMAVVEAKELHFSRPIRLLHPRNPCYIVPWPNNQYMIGATVIESDDEGPVCVRSGLELLGAAFTVHPGFGEAKILELSAGTRPSFPDNIPKIIAEGSSIMVNGAYRHGFLLAPLLAAEVSSYIREGDRQGAFFQ